MKTILSILFFVLCLEANCQSLKITSINVPGIDQNELAKYAIGKVFKLTFYKDSLTVYLAPLDQTILFRNKEKDVYLHIDSNENVKTTYLLKIQNSNAQISSVNMQITDEPNGGKTVTGSIIAKPN